MHLLPQSGVVSRHFQKTLPLLLVGALLYMAPGMAAGQSVTFADAQSTLQANGLEKPAGVAVDSADVFISDTLADRVVELPWTGTGFGRQTTVPFTGLPTGEYSFLALFALAVDSAGDLFLANSYGGNVLELPWTGSGYGPQITTPQIASPSCCSNTPFFWLAVDGAKNLFFTTGNGEVSELPWTGTGYGTPVAITDFLGPIAVDGSGDLFIAYDGITELLKTETGFGPPQTVITTNQSGPLALDSAGDLFLASDPVLEFPLTGTSYGPPISLPVDGFSGSYGLAVDGSGDVFISDTSNSRVMELQTRSVNFESVNVCGSGQTTPAPCSITLPLHFNVTASGTLGTPKVAPGDFTLAGGSTCNGPVSKGEICTVNVTFKPTALGARNGSVEITGGEGNVLATVPLSGTGVPAGTLTPPVLQVSANGNIMYFNSVAVGTSVTHSLQVFNAGTGRYAGTLTVTPSTDAQSFKVVGNSCAGGVRSAHGCWLQIEFSPVDAATIHGTLTLENNGAATATVALHGVGVPQ
jgi:hypothetical protein